MFSLSLLTQLVVVLALFTALAQADYYIDNTNQTIQYSGSYWNWEFAGAYLDVRKLYGGSWSVHFISLSQWPFTKCTKITVQVSLSLNFSCLRMFLIGCYQGSDCLTNDLCHMTITFTGRQSPCRPLSFQFPMSQERGSPFMPQ